MPKIIPDNRGRWIAILFSAILPGSGQFLKGELAPALLFTFSFFILGYTYFFTSSPLLENGYHRIYIWLSTTTLAAAGIIYLINVIHAFRIPTFPTHPNIKWEKNKNPYLAGLLTLLIPGLGQIYNKQILKAILSYVIVIIVSTLFSFLEYSERANAISSSIFDLLFSLVLFYDAVISACRKNEHSEEELIKQTPKILKTLIFILLITGIFSTIAEFQIKEFALRAYKLPTGDMQPTLRGKEDYGTGDHILVNRLQSANFKRGDLIAFKYPQDPSKHYLKRIIGLPEEKIEIINKKIHINGKILQEPWLQEYPIKAYYLEFGTFQTREKSMRDNFGPIVIPQNTYFVLGDNRDNSSDSRYWGVVDKTLIIGKPVAIYYPFKRMRWLN